MRKEKIQTIIRYQIIFIILFAALVAALILNINTGSVKVSAPEIFRIIFLREGQETTAYDIIWRIRLPRLIAAAVLGGALGVSGYMLQTFFRNPIASPFVLGVSSGAKTAIAFTLIFLSQVTGRVSSIQMVLASFVGSLLSMGLILLCSKKLQSMSMLLVLGIMVGYICSAATDFMITFAKDSDIVSVTSWHMGTFASTKWEHVAVMSAVVFAGTLLAFLISKPMGAYQLGEGYAISMGINIKFTRAAIILISSLLSATVTAFAGPISFVGIAVPHVVKLMFKTAKPIVVLPGSFLFGAVFCMFCDLIARTAFSPTEMAISTVTAIFGAPIVIAMLLSNKVKEHA